VRRLVTVVLLLLLAVPVPPAAAAEARADKALIVSLPRLTWADLEELGTPPALQRLLDRSALASMSPRTIGPRTSLGEGYATIGAGNRAGVSTAGTVRLGAEDAEGGLAFHRDETFGGDPVPAVHARRTGHQPDGEVLHIGVAALARTNDRLLYGAEVGALGSALRAAGRRTAVVANADVTERLEPIGFHRDAAMAVMDEHGNVDAGSVSREIVSEDALAPFGLTLSPPAVVAAFDRAWAAADVVLVENSDLERADAAALLSSGAATRAARQQALERFDIVLDHVLRTVELDRTLIVVVAPAAPRRLEQLTVAAVSGPGIERGTARSGSTRRDGYVTLTDVAPTVLEALGIDQPSSMSGTAMTATSAEVSPDDLVVENERATFRDDATGPVSVAFIAFQVIAYALAVVALTRRSSKLRTAAAFGALVTLAVPPLAFLSGLFRYDGLGVAGYGGALFAAAAVLAAVAWIVGARLHPMAPPLLLIGITLAVLLGDVVTGGRLQLNTVLGYSPIVAGRFAGFGNLAAALVSVSAIIVATGAWATGRVPLAVPAVALAVVVVIGGSPGFGSDVGGVLANVPAFVVTVALLAGVRIGWRRAALVAGGTIGLLAVFAAVDLARPASTRTHLGRLVARVGDEGWDGLSTVLQRKLAANISILTSSAWAYVIPVAFLFLAFLVWRPQGFLRSVLERVPGLRACLVGAVVAGVLGFSLNDSGVAVPAMMLAVLLPYLTFLVVRTTAAEAAPAAGTPAGTSRGAGTRS
jgi:hypothetical protein